jgi:hypothetical protein
MTVNLPAFTSNPPQFTIEKPRFASGFCQNPQQKRGKTGPKKIHCKRVPG